jgi:hypothetical protein
VGDHTCLFVYGIGPIVGRVTLEGRRELFDSYIERITRKAQRGGASVRTRNLWTT